MREYTFDDFLSEQLNKDPEFAKLWEDDRNDRELRLAIVRAMTAKNMSVKELADAVRITRRRMQKILIGDADPKLKELIRIAKALDCELLLVTMQETSKEN